MKRLSILSMAMGVFVLASCTDDTIDEQTTVEVGVSQQTALTLLQPDEPIIIDDLGSTELKTTDAAGDDRGRFNISLKFVVPVSAEQEQVFDDAAARWERIIIEDVPSFTGTIPSAFRGFPPASTGTLDDIVIEVALAPIDGPGGILGSAGPRFVRTSDFLTLSGVMFFDVDDLAFLDQIGLFEEVIVHEMGHVLGVGTLWGFQNDLLQDPDGNPYFSGSQANVFWNAEGGTAELPIENIGGPGTRLGHWRESVMGNELMTGFLNLGENPLSRITAGSMSDLGYGAAPVGETYALPKGAPGVDPSASDAEGGLNIGSMEELLLPIGFATSEE